MGRWGAAEGRHHLRIANVRGHAPPRSHSPSHSSLFWMPPAVFFLAVYPFYAAALPLTLALTALLAVKDALLAANSPTAVVRGLVC